MPVIKRRIGSSFSMPITLPVDADSPVKVEAEVQAEKLLQAILANAQMTRQADGE